MNKVKFFHLSFVLAICVLVISCISSSSPSHFQSQDEIARGGRLYDKWFKVIDSPTPSKSHSKYPPNSSYAKKPGSTWRCKECHGWDYKGKNGVYGAGKHFTGIQGIDSLKGKSVSDFMAKFTNKHQEFGNMFSKEDLKALALFVNHGQMNMNQYIDPVTTKAKGNADKGKIYYRTLCSSCHGAEGKMEDMPVMGTLSRKNPWECLHKILNGQPEEDMPALRALDIQVSIDVLSYLQILPD